jgi:hypothetical protein
MLVFFGPGGKNMSRIKNIVPKDGCRLELQLEDGSSIPLKLSDKLQLALFRLLADKLSIKREGEDNSYLCWGDEIEISLDDLIRLTAEREDSPEKPVE